jgi:hypothetical protein
LIEELSPAGVPPKASIDQLKNPPSDEMITMQRSNRAREGRANALRSLPIGKAHR